MIINTHLHIVYLMKFIDRERELKRMYKLYDSDRAELSVIYGRRRVGKTELVKRSVKGRENVVVYQAKQKTKSLQIDQFIEVASTTYPKIENIKKEWDTLLRFLTEQDAIVVLDEFPYLVEEDKSLPSELQSMFDHELSGSSSTIVLVGSSISMMEEAALLGHSPLYGRASDKLDLQPLNFEAALKFLDPEYTPEEKVIIWSIFGGMPHYLERASRASSLKDAVSQSILYRDSPLRHEPDYILRMELTEPVRYFSILEAIAGGSAVRNEIAQTTGIDREQLSKYLARLERLRLIERKVPITEKKERSRRGRYHIKDSLFRFWFRFIYGTGSRYDEFGEEAFETIIEPALADHASEEFENLCGKALRPLYPGEVITDIGRWWYKEHEIDVVGLTDDGSVIAGECKFTNSPVGYKALSRLEEHVKELRWTSESGDRRNKFALFSRSGFKRSVKEEEEKRDDLRLFTVEDVVDALTRGA